MTEKEFEKLDIYVNKDGAYVASSLKDGKPGKNKKVLDEKTITSLVMWYIDKKCVELSATDFTINVGNVPFYKLENLMWAEQSKKAKEEAEKGRE